MPPSNHTFTTFSIGDSSVCHCHLWRWNTSCRTVRPTTTWEYIPGLLTYRWRRTAACIRTTTGRNLFFFYTQSARTVISGRATVVPVSERRRRRRRAEFQIAGKAMTTTFWYIQALPFLFLLLLRRSGYVSLWRLAQCYWYNWINATCPEMTLCSRQYARIQSLLPFLWSYRAFSARVVPYQHGITRAFVSESTVCSPFMRPFLNPKMLNYLKTHRWKIDLDLIDDSSCSIIEWVAAAAVSTKHIRKP